MIDAREMGDALDSIETHAPEYAKAKLKGYTLMTTERYSLRSCTNTQKEGP